MVKEVYIPYGFKKMTGALRGYFVNSKDNSVWSAKSGELKELAKRHGSYRARQGLSYPTKISEKLIQSAAKSRAPTAAYYRLPSPVTR